MSTKFDRVKQALGDAEFSRLLAQRKSAEKVMEDVNDALVIAWNRDLRKAIADGKRRPAGPMEVSLSSIRGWRQKLNLPTSTRPLISYPNSWETTVDD